MDTETEKFFDELTGNETYSIATSTEDLFTKDGLYKHYDLNNFTVTKIYPYLYNPNTVDVYCPECKKMSTFSSDLTSQPKHNEWTPFSPAEWLSQLIYLQGSVIEGKLICSRNKDHQIRIFLLVSISENQSFRLTKIGQYPSIADLSKYEIEKFKKILGDHYREYNTALGLFSHGVGVGSFTYLRRVLENFIVKPAIEKSIKLGNYKKEDFEGKRTKDRVKMVKDELPPFLVENAELYSILSMGLHETTEKECLEMFPLMHDSMLVILEEIKSLQDVEKRRENLSNAIKNKAREAGKNT